MAEDIDDYKIESHMFALFKGDPGTAKSPAACSWPEPYVLDTDGRIASVANYYRGKKKIRYDTIINDFPKLNEKLEALLRYNPYGTIVLDGITTVARSLAALIFQARGAGVQRKKEDGSKREYLNAATIPGKFGGIAQLEIDDYKTENGGLIQTLDALRAIWSNGCHIIVVAHVVTVEMPQLKGGPKITRSIMTGGRKVAAEIPIYFNEAYHFNCSTLGDRKYEIITRNTGDDWAKTALPIPDSIDFTNKSLYEEIQTHIEIYKKENPHLFEKKETVSD
jgi:hypothetical protein